MRKLTGLDNNWRSLLFSVGFTSLLITPIYSYDSFNVPKLVALSGTAFLCLALLIIKRRELSNNENKKYLLFSIVFIFDLLLILLTKHDQPFTDAFFGIASRYTGFLTYLSLGLIALVSILYSRESGLSSVINVLLVTGAVSTGYGLLQSFNLDPFEWGNQAGSHVMGFLGNPNFQSSFMALIALLVIFKLTDSTVKSTHRFGYLFYLMCTLFVLYKTSSTQGFLLTGFGLLIGIHAYLKTNPKFKKLSFPFGILSILAIFLAIADIFQMGPWKSFLYSYTVSLRGDYWRAGWKMTTEFPIFGVGFDGYRDHFRTLRDHLASVHPGADSPTDAAHNVFLDISSSGGFPFVLLYLTFIITAFVIGIRTYKNMKKYDFKFVAVFVLFVSYLLQSLISINQIGLAVWGWLLGGILVGYGNSLKEIKVENGKKAHTSQKIGAAGLIAVWLAGVCISLPPLLADHALKRGIDSKQVGDLISSVDKWPQAVMRINLVAGVLVENKFYKEAYALSHKAIKLNPTNFEAWRVLIANPILSDEEKRFAIARMFKLDPNLKVPLGL